VTVIDDATAIAYVVLLAIFCYGFVDMNKVGIYVWLRDGLRKLLRNE
jgi:hypothetical protein